MKIKNHICRHLQAVGLNNTESARIASLIAKWHRNNGTEWVVKRLKVLKDTLKLNLATGSYNIPPGFATRRNSRGKTILVDGQIHRLLCAKSSRQIQTALAVFMSSNFFKLDDISKAQKSKFDEAVMGEPTMDTQLVEVVEDHIETSLNKVNPKLIQKWCQSYDKIDITPLRYYPPSEKKSPVLGYTKKVNCTKINADSVSVNWNQIQFDTPDYEDCELISCSRSDIDTLSIDILSVHKDWHQLTQDYPVETMRCLFGEYGPEYIRPIPRVHLDVDRPPIGTIGYIQEPSAKLRAVANPFLAIQALGEPLKKKLEVISKMIPEINTFDQDAGRQWTEQQLGLGKTLFAYDASSFTDRLPVRVQLKILKSFRDLNESPITDFDIRVMELASEGTYRDIKFKRDVKWTQGQPQGFGPSFHLAANTHSILAMLACQRAGVRPLKGEGYPFRVIGDDIVIADSNVAKYYLEIMTEILGVEINQEKSVISDNISEFAGKIITRDSIIPSMKPKFKEHTADSIVKLIEFYGTESYHLFNFNDDETRFRRKTLLPYYLGGLRLKPRGVEVSFNWEKIQQHILRRELKSYVSPYGDNQVKLFFTRISDFDRINDTGISESEFEVWFKQKVKPIPKTTEDQVFKLLKLSNGVIRSNQLESCHVRQDGSPSHFLKLLGSMIRHDLTNLKLRHVDDTTNEHIALPKEKEWLGHFGMPYDYVNIFLEQNGYQIDEKFKHLIESTRTHSLGTVQEKTQRLYNEQRNEIRSRKASNSESRRIEGFIKNR